MVRHQAHSIPSHQHHHTNHTKHPYNKSSNHSNPHLCSTHTNRPAGRHQHQHRAQQPIPNCRVSPQMRCTSNNHLLITHPALTHCNKRRPIPSNQLPHHQYTSTTGSLHPSRNQRRLRLLPVKQAAVMPNLPLPTRTCRKVASIATARASAKHKAATRRSLHHRAVRGPRTPVPPFPPVQALSGKALIAEEATNDTAATPLEKKSKAAEKATQTPARRTRGEATAEKREDECPMIHPSKPNCKVRTKWRRISHAMHHCGICFRLLFSHLWWGTSVEGLLLCGERVIQDTPCSFVVGKEWKYCAGSSMERR